MVAQYFTFSCMTRLITWCIWFLASPGVMGTGVWDFGGAPHIFMHTIPSAWIMFCILSAWVCASFACFAFRSLALSGAFLQPLMPSAVAFHLCLGDPTRQRVFWILAPFFSTLFGGVGPLKSYGLERVILLKSANEPHFTHMQTVGFDRIGAA